jgi:hypothetical protein
MRKVCNRLNEAELPACYSNHRDLVAMFKLLQKVIRNKVPQAGVAARAIVAWKLIQNPCSCAISLVLAWGILSVEFVEAADSQLSATQVNDSALNVTNRINDEITALREQLSALESEYGSYHQALLAPLRDLTSLQVELGNLDDAVRLLNRRLQIRRVIYSPTNLSQLDSIFELISIEIRQQNWQSVTALYEFVEWLAINNPNSEAEQRLNLLKRVSSWRIAAIYLDINDNREEHLLQLEEIVDRIVSLARVEYGDNSPLLAPWLYLKAKERLLRHSYRRFPNGESGRLGVVNFTHQAYLLVKEIREIIEATGDPEAQAMAMVFEADFLKFYTSDVWSDRLYREARQKFLELGIPEQKVSGFFDAPTIIPMRQLHLSIASAMTEQQPIVREIEFDDKSAQTVNIIYFLALEESHPFLPRPEMPDEIANAEENLNSVLIQIDIPSYLNEIAVLNSIPDALHVRSHARFAASQLVFRPIPSGRWRQAKRTVTVLYRYPR